MLDEEPLRYFLTYKTSQDHLELFFFCLRSRGGWNNNPNSLQLKWSLRQLLLRNSITPSFSANCTELMQYCTPAFAFRSEKREQKQVKSNNIDDISDMMENLERRSLSNLIENIFYYICGYVVRTLTNDNLCNDCLNILLYREENIFMDHEYSKPQEHFKKFTSCVTRGGLLYSSNVVYEIVTFMEKQFQSLIEIGGVLKGQYNLKRKLVNSVIKHFLQKIHKFLPKHPITEEFMAEESHEIKIIRKIVDIYIKCKMHHYSRLMNLKIHGKDASIRQKMTKLILFKNC